MVGEGAFQTNQTKENWLAGIELNWNIFDNNLTNTEVARAKSAQLEKAIGLPIEIDTALYKAAIDDGKNASKTLERSSILPSTILDENGKVKKTLKRRYKSGEKIKGGRMSLR